ncbi:MAG: 23S rRNA (uracil(1939)-C(5))-methyltransferase RlmD [Eubacteriales bacterium]|nr:23S rRNA (uracil(1939)-C(5))-methyltransferase RlmD [Eubacteriales bacterium]
MITKNENYTVDIKALSHDFAGIARIDGQVVFVPFAIPQEKCNIKIVKTQKSMAFGKLINVIEPSDKRATPFCPIFYKCGGCSCQHMRYEASLEHKRQIVKDALNKIAGIDIPVLDTVRADNPLNYRNKTSMPVGLNDSKPVAGFFYPRSHRIVPVESCPIAKPEADTINRVVLEWMDKFNIAPYQEESHTGLIRHIVSRVNSKGESMCILVSRSTKIPHIDELIKLLKESLPSIVSVVINLQSERGNRILGDSGRIVYGENHIKEKLCGLEFFISPLSFFQINTAQAEKLYNTALELAGDLSKKEVLDLYCGSGTISLAAAKKARFVRGIEIVPEAIEYAKVNQIHNGIENAEFFAGQVEKLLPKWVKDGYKADVVILDPPRKGAEKSALQAIAQTGAQKIIYVSCNPATQARDIKTLQEYGYNAIKAVPVDMFCYTSGVESVVLLSKLGVGSI